MKYRPSNGTEGMIFMDEFCDRCYYDRNQDCPIIVLTMCLETEDKDYPPEWIYIGETPTCTKFRADRYGPDDGPSPPQPKIPEDPNQLCLPFEFNEIMAGQVDKTHERRRNNNRTAIPKTII